MFSGTHAARGRSPIVIAEQGSRHFGGRVIDDGSGSTAHVDHGYVEWQIPESPRPVALLLWHSSSTRTWEMSFSGDEGFKTLFLRLGFPVYVIDAPQLGRAGWSSRTYTYAPETGHDQRVFNSFRFGLWNPPEAPTFYPNVQFPANDPDALDQLFRASYPEFNMPDNVQLQSDEVAKLVDRVGHMVLITHSGSGLRGWWTALKSSGVKGIVSYEPNSFVLPEGEVPPPLERADGATISAHNDPLGSAVAREKFEKLTRIPIQIVFGDNIPTRMDPQNVGPRLVLDNRRLGVIRSNIFIDALNRHGGKAALLKLPDVGLRGNTHFPMQDLNYRAVADQLFAFLDANGLA